MHKAVSFRYGTAHFIKLAYVLACYLFCKFGIYNIRYFFRFKFIFFANLQRTVFVFVKFHLYFRHFTHHSYSYHYTFFSKYTRFIGIIIIRLFSDLFPCKSVYNTLIQVFVYHTFYLCFRHFCSFI